MAKKVKNLPAVQETRVRSLGAEDPLEEEMNRNNASPLLNLKYSNSVFLPGEFHGQRNLVVYSPWVCKELDTTE